MKDGFYNLPGREPGSGFTDVVVSGDYAYLAGKVATEVGRPVQMGQIEDETRACMEVLSRVLELVGLSFADVVRTNVHMTDLKEFDRMNGVYMTFFEDGRVPARTTVGAPELVFGCRVEIDCIARMRKG